MKCEGIRRGIENQSREQLVIAKRFFVSRDKQESSPYRESFGGHGHERAVGGMDEQASERNAAPARLRV